MSRKSLSGKKKVELWFYCEKCYSHITHKDWDSHTKFCSIDEKDAVGDATIVGDANLSQSKFPTQSFIRNGILYTTNLDIKKPTQDLIDVPIKQQNKLIFMSETAMRLCNFVIGEEIAIICKNDLLNSSLTEITKNQEEIIFVRMVWPISDSFLTTVFVSEQDFDLYWKFIKGQQIKICKLTSDPEPIEQVTLKLINSENLDINFLSDLQKFLKIHLRGFIFHEKCFISCNFFNKDLKLQIINFKSNINNELEQKFSQLTVSHELNSYKFLKIHNDTRIEIIENEKENEFSKKPKDNKFKNHLTKDDIGGLDDLLKNIEETINLSLGLKKSIPGMKISKGLILFGPTGCGKTMICEAIANNISNNVEILKINSCEIFSKFYGETEKNLQKYFDKIYKNYPKSTLIIIEDINNLCPKYEINEITKRISIAFLNILDNLHLKKETSKCFILATTSDLDNLNSSLRRCGRFDIELEISVPNPDNRYEILKKYLQKIENNLSNEQIKEISNITHGFVGSDLSNLISKAALISLKKFHKKIEISHIFEALNYVKPSAMREISIENPNVHWEDIGGQDELKLKLKQAIEWPLLYPEKFEKFGIKPPRGILMFGPPGCSKTMIAKALATESRLNFLSIKGPELFSMWVGESERAVREVFRKAKQVSPSIIFFDEIDAIGGERSSDSGSSVKERVLAQLLTELDGVTTLKNVTIVAATNRPDMIDKALMRPGRIDRIIYVDLPDYKTRYEIFKIKMKKMPLSDDVNFEELIKLTDGYSGAEIQAICQEAALKALEESLQSNEVCWRHFEYSLKLVKPRTSPELLKLYSDYLKQS